MIITGNQESSDTACLVLILCLAGSGSQRSGMSRKTSGLGQSQFYGKASSGSTADAHVRSKVAEQFTIALEKVTQEAGKTEALPAASAVAEKVEQELFKFFGENKAYWGRRL